MHRCLAAAAAETQYLAGKLQTRFLRGGQRHQKRAGWHRVSPPTFWVAKAKTGIEQRFVVIKTIVALLVPAVLGLRLSNIYVRAADVNPFLSRKVSARAGKRTNFQRWIELTGSS